MAGMAPVELDVKIDVAERLVKELRLANLLALAALLPESQKPTRDSIVASVAEELHP